MPNKSFVVISGKKVEVSSYIKDWAKRTVSSLEDQGVPSEGIEKIVVGTIATKAQLHNYCFFHNLDYKKIHKIVFE